MDTILIGALRTTSLVKIGINLGDIIQLDGVPDLITVEEPKLSITAPFPLKTRWNCMRVGKLAAVLAALLAALL